MSPKAQAVLQRLTPLSLLAVAASASAFVLTPPATAYASGATVSVVPRAEVEKLLSRVPLADLPQTPLTEILAEDLSATPTGTLQELIGKTVAGLAAEGATLEQLAGSSALSEELEKQLSGLSPLEQLGVEGLLGLGSGETVSSVLDEQLGALDARELVAALLKSAGEPGQLVGPEQLAERILTATNTEMLEQLLGSTLSGTPFTKGTVEELATQAGTTTEVLAQDFGTTPAQLPGSAMALTAPLKDGNVLGVVDPAEGLEIFTLTPELTGPSGGSGGSSGVTSGGTGGSGGSGGATTSPAPGGVTIINQLVVPSSSASPSAAPPLPGASSERAAKVTIVSRKVKGDTVTLTVQTSGAGTILVEGKGWRSATARAKRAQRLTVRAVLSKAEVAHLRRRHRRVSLPVEVSFRPVGGAAAAAARTTVTFH